MGNMRFKVGDRVRIKSLDWYNENKNKFGKVWTSDGEIPFDKCMSEWCGKVMPHHIPWKWFLSQHQTCPPAPGQRYLQAPWVHSKKQLLLWAQ